IIDGDETLDVKEGEIHQLNERTWRVSGNVSLVLLSKTIALEFPDDYETVSGFVLGLYGEVPEDGTFFEVEYEGTKIKVNDVQDHRAVSTVFVLPEKEENQEEE
ncbi:MAG: hypothetical protein IKU24_01345, partial [Clostridia bacterium]|nr:hypothetical protein [Clostridia bacterium]